MSNHGITDMYAVSQENGKCSDLDTFTVAVLLSVPIFYGYYKIYHRFDQILLMLEKSSVLATNFHCLYNDPITSEVLHIGEKADPNI